MHILEVVLLVLHMLGLAAVAFGLFRQLNDETKSVNAAIAHGAHLGSWPVVREFTCAVVAVVVAVISWLPRRPSGG